MHQLPNLELTNSEAALSTSPGPSRPQGTPWGPHILQTGPAERRGSASA